MFEPKEGDKPTYNPETHHVVTNYEAIANSPIKQKFEAELEAYDSAKANANNEGTRKLIMQTFGDRCKDLALEAETAGDNSLQDHIDRYIQSMAKRSKTRFYSKSY